jgi:hypothetical protein
VCVFTIVVAERQRASFERAVSIIARTPLTRLRGGDSGCDGVDQEEEKEKKTKKAAAAVLVVESGSSDGNDPEEF